MWSNRLTLKVNSILTMSINSIRCSMCLSKHQEHSMNALRIFLLKIVLGLVNVTPTFCKNNFFCANRSAYQIVVHMKNFPKINLV
jgi:hypothetical protein